MSFGAVLQPEVDVVDLQYALIRAFREAAIDEGHLASQLASLLSRLFPSEDVRAVNSQQKDSDDEPQAFDLVAFLDFDMGSLDVSSLGDIVGDPSAPQNIIGCDPNGLVSVIEDMLAGGWSQGPGAGGHGGGA